MGQATPLPKPNPKFFSGFRPGLSPIFFEKPRLEFDPSPTEPGWASPKHPLGLKIGLAPNLARLAHPSSGANANNIDEEIEEELANC